MRLSLFALLFTCTTLFTVAELRAEEAPEKEETTGYSLIIKGHTFTPSEITIPANKRVKLIIDNQDDSAEEFESHELNREKVIAAKSKGVVLIGPLKPGSYKFVGEFHEETAKGTIIVK
ncbi:MAG: cupredoxin domain-containing protein [Proteobacteria bacterium]|nr:cupredoxin domain-containing protein [Pseudomonadota bacterium]